MTALVDKTTGELTRAHTIWPDAGERAAVLWANLARLDPPTVYLACGMHDTSALTIAGSGKGVSVFQTGQLLERPHIGDNGVRHDPETPEPWGVTISGSDARLIGAMLARGVHLWPAANGLHVRVGDRGAHVVVQAQEVLNHPTTPEELPVEDGPNRVTFALGGLRAVAGMKLPGLPTSETLIEWTLGNAADLRFALRGGALERVVGRLDQLW